MEKSGTMSVIPSLVQWIRRRVGVVRFEETLRLREQGIEYDSLSYCHPPGYPRWITEPNLREFVVTPDQTWLMNELANDVRRVYTDARRSPGRGMDHDVPRRGWEGTEPTKLSGRIRAILDIRRVARHCLKTRQRPTRIEAVHCPRRARS